MTDGVDNYLAVGNPCLDLVSSGYVLGGSSFYAAIQAHRFGLSARIVGLVDPTVRDDLTAFLAPFGIDLEGLLPAQSTTRFENRYDEDGVRLQVMIAPGERVPASQLPRTTCSVLHLAPIADEVDLAAIVREGRVRAGFVGLTAQGLLRRRAAGGPVTHQPVDIPAETACEIDAVIVGRDEAQYCESLLDAVHAAGGVVVVTDGASGAVARGGGTTIRIAPHQTKAVDPTGAGDVFAAALFIALSRGESLQTAGAWASAAAACCVSGEGATQIATFDEVMRLVQQHGAEEPGA